MSLNIYFGAHKFNQSPKQSQNISLYLSFSSFAIIAKLLHIFNFEAYAISLWAIANCSISMIHIQSNLQNKVLFPSFSRHHKHDAFWNRYLEFCTLCRIRSQGYKFSRKEGIRFTLLGIFFFFFLYIYIISIGSLDDGNVLIPFSV